MDAEKQAMQQRIDTLDQHAVKLHAALTEYERENAQLKAELETVKRERDALMYDLIDSSDCATCMYSRCMHPEDNSCSDCELDCPCKICINGKNQYKWRGLCKENGGVEDA